MTSLCVKYLPSSLPGHNLHTLIWQPEHPKAIVQIVHGMSEHIARYDELARWLCDRGIAVIGHSHLGHGLTAASADDLGYIADKHGWERLTDDIHTVRAAAYEMFPGLPVILLGHSMGSFAVRTYITRPQSSGLSGVILSGTGHQPAAVIGAGKAMTSLVRLFKGRRHRSKFLDSLSFGGNNKPFEPGRTAYDWLSKNEENVDLYIADPLCGFCFTTGGFRDLFDGLGYIGKKKNIARNNKTLPCLFVSGQYDPVGGNGKGVLHVADMFRKAGMTDVQVRLYDDDRHEVLNETDRFTVYADIYDFIARFITEGTAS